MLVYIYITRERVVGVVIRAPARNLSTPSLQKKNGTGRCFSFACSGHCHRTRSPSGNNNLKQLEGNHNLLRTKMLRFIKLCHKILVNVGRLTSADRGSLFLVEMDYEEDEETSSNSSDPDAKIPFLVPKLFDVTVDSGKHENHVTSCSILA